MTRVEKTNKRRIRNDIIFVGVLLLLTCIFALYLFFLREEGDVVKVTVDGELYATYLLSEDRVEEIRTGNDGSRINRLVIKEGKAYVEFATCPDGICKDHRAVFRDGESIVCLPNRVVITVVSDESKSAPDVIS